MVEKDFDLKAILKIGIFQEMDSQYKFLPIDTKYFKDLEIEILALFDDIDDALDGRLINSENYQALNTLQNKYKEKVQCVYIDPPYNTKEDDFLYKDGFKHSSWLSMMSNRILAMKPMVQDNGRFFCSIDDRENSKLLELLYNHLGRENYLNSITWEKRTKSQNTSTAKYTLQSKIEYIHPFKFTVKRQEFNLEVSGQKEYPEKDKNGKYRIQKAEMDSLDRAHAAQSMFYPILGIEPTQGKCWKFGTDTADEYIKDDRIFLKDGWPYIIFRPEHEDQDIHKPFWSHFFEKETYGTAESGLNLLDKQLGFGKEFQTVKPLPLIKKILFHSTNKNDLILDFFAGSGTTAHATIDLNRDDDGKRKYLLIEMGDYFDSLIIPRIKKVCYSSEWKEGKPKNTNGFSQFFKYYSLEQYEDTLRNMKYVDYKQTELWASDKKTFEEYIFYADQKFADILKVEKDNLQLNFNKLYENIDFPETISNVLGLPIKRITKDSVILLDGKNEKEINTDYENMTNDEKLQFVRLLKPLLWWGK